MTEATVWDFFVRRPEDENRAVCRLCENIFSCSTSHNLRSHLKLKHNDLVEVPSAATGRKTSKTRNIVWKHFTPIDEQLKLASCNLCGKCLSFKSTVANLKTHLRKVHREVLDEEESDLVNVDEEVYFEVSDDENSNDSTSTLWSYFKEVGDTQMRCLLCGATIPSSGDDVRRHMREQHSKLDVEATDEEENQETEANDVFSEVVYLDDNGKQRDAKKQRRKFQSINRIEERKRSKARRKRTGTRERTSDSSDEVLAAQRASFSGILAKIPKKIDGGDELDKFGTYVTSLLKTVPNDVCIKLQMDILNLIMTEKLKSSMQEKKLVPDHAPVTLQIVETAPVNELPVVLGDDNSDTVTGV